MVRTVTRKSPNAAKMWYRLGKSANKRVKRSSSSRRKELNKLRSMKKVTKRILEEKLKRSYLRDGYKWNRNSSPKNIKFRKPIRLRKDPSGRIIILSSSPRISSRSKSSSRSSRTSSRSQYQPDGSFKACPPGKTRSRKGHCVKIWSRSPRRKSLKSAYELNSKTGRLRKVCPSGKKRSRKGRCVRI